MTLARAPGASDRVIATVRFSDPSQVRDAEWLSSLAWQGREPLHNRPLKEIGPGLYRSEPMPVGGSWKTTLRVHKDGVLSAMPVSLPGDPAIPAAVVPAAPRFERAFVADSDVLQRECKTDVAVGHGGAGRARLLRGAGEHVGLGLRLRRRNRGEWPPDPPEGNADHAGAGGSARVTLVLAHGGHWLEGLAFGMPVLAPPRPRSPPS